MHRIAQDIYWTGFIDWDLRNFHGYSTPSGSTYNAYLILDDKPTLIDTVKHYGFDEMLSRIGEVIDPAKIQYIVSNHTEMDHSGAIDRLLAFCPQAQVVCSPKGAEELKRHFKKEWHFRVVSSGDTLNIGKRTLQFVLMPMVHWPDSMATYLPQDHILFPNDAFGQHYASVQRHVDEVGLGLIAREAAKYYANIVMPYGAQVTQVLEALKAVPMDMICPSHGLIWRKKEDIEFILRSYRAWAAHEAGNSVAIIYDTMWHSTQRMAQRLFELLDREGVSVRLVNLQTSHISDAMTDVMNSKFVCVGSPILNNKILPTVSAFLTYLSGLKPKKRFAFTFGSYGWSKAGFKMLEDALKDGGLEMLGEGLYLQFVPDESELAVLQAVVAKIKTLIQA